MARTPDQQKFEEARQAAYLRERKVYRRDMRNGFIFLIILIVGLVYRHTIGG